MTRTLLTLFLLAAALHAEDHVLLVGCTEYPNLRDQPGYKAFIRLFGSENDVRLVREALIESLGIGKDRVTELAGWDVKNPARNPTRANILGQLDRLARTATRGDRVIILLAGHGSQQPDRSGDELDGLDEIFLPCDVKGWNQKKGEVENSIPDDELAKHVRAIRDTKASIWLLMDCCHAGTMVRGADAFERSRRLAPSVLGVPAAHGPRAGKQSPLDDLTGVAAMYAAPSFRTTTEMRLPRRTKGADWHGVFSFTLAAQLRRTGGDITFRQLHAQMVAAYQALPYHGTIPVAEGDLDRTLKGAADGRPPLWVRWQNDRLVLNAGRIAGVAPGTKLRVTRLNGKPLGLVEVVEAELTRSVCRAPAKLKLPRDEILPATIEESPLGDLRLRVLAGEGEEISTCLASPRFVRVTDAEDADFVLRAAQDGSYRLRPGRAGTAVEFTVRPGALQHALERVHRVENLKRVAGGGRLGSLPTGLEVELQRNGARVGAGDLLRPGDAVEAVVRNRTGKAWDLTLLALDSHYGINELFPGNASARLDAQADGERRIGPFDITDDSQGVEHMLALAVPADEKREPVSLGWLAHGALRTRGAQRDIERLFEQLAHGRQRGAAVRRAAVSALLLTWRTGYGAVAPPDRFPEAATPCFRPAHALSAQDLRASRIWEPAVAGQRTRGSLAALYGRVAPSVVVVRTRTGHGTGFAVGAGGLVLTNAHVVAQGYATSKAGRPRVTVHRGKLQPDGTMQLNAQSVEADVVAIDERLDLALLEANAAKDLQPIALAPGGPRPGDDCVLIGHPSSGLLWSLRAGRVSSIGRMPHDMVNAAVARLAAKNAATAREQLAALPPVKIALSDCGANPGDSGSPLVDPQGRLVAVTYAIPAKERDDKFVYHVHVDAVRAFLETPRTNGPLVPDAWRLGPRVGLARSDPKGGYDLLVAGADKPEQILLDIDGDAGKAKPTDVARLVRERAFDAEIALHFAADRRTAFYDTDNDGTFDLVLVDEDADPEADVRFKRGEKGWTVETGIAVHWLSADHLAGDEAKARAVAKLRALRIP